MGLNDWIEVKLKRWSRVQAFWLGASLGFAAGVLAFIPYIARYK